MSTEIVIPGTADATSLILPSELSFEDWQEIGRTICNANRAVKWWIGDWINYGENVYGEKYAQALEVTGLDYGTLQNIAYTCRKIAIQTRNPNLTFAHHTEVAQLSNEDQLELLKAAEEENLPVKEVRFMVKARKPGKPEGEKTEFSCSVTIKNPIWIQVEAASKEAAEAEAFKALKSELDQDDLIYDWAKNDDALPQED